jgi:hypothetical protein
MSDTTPGSPRTYAEQLTADVWQQILGTDEVDRADNFFLLGGSSRAALAVAAALTERLGAKVPVRLVYQYSDLSAFAEQLPQAKEGALLP